MSQCFWTDLVGCAENCGDAPMPLGGPRLNLIGANYLTATFPWTPATGMLSSSGDPSLPDSQNDVGRIDVQPGLYVGSAAQTVNSVWFAGGKGCVFSVSVPARIAPGSFEQSGTTYNRPPVSQGTRPAVYVCLDLQLSVYYTTGRYLSSLGRLVLYDLDKKSVAFSSTQTDNRSVYGSGYAFSKELVFDYSITGNNDPASLPTVENGLLTVSTVIDTTSTTSGDITPSTLVERASVSIFYRGAT